MLRRKRCWKAAVRQHAYEDILFTPKGFVNKEGVAKEKIRSDEEEEALLDKQDSSQVMILESTLENNNKSYLKEFAEN